MKVVVVFTTPSSKGTDRISLGAAQSRRNIHTNSSGEEASIGSINSDAFELPKRGHVSGTAPRCGQPVGTLTTVGE